MALLRTLLNNGFFVLVLVVAVSLYLAYSGPQPATANVQAKAENQNNKIDSQENIAPTKPAQTSAQVSRETQPSTSAKAKELTAAPASDKKTSAAIQGAANADDRVDPTTKTAPESSGDTHNTNKNATEPPEPAKTKVAKNSTPAKQAADEIKQPPQTKKTNKATQPTDTNKTPVASQPKANNTVFATELDAFLADSNQSNAKFKTPQDAVFSARRLMQQQQYKNAANAFLSAVRQAPSANLMGEMARALYFAGEQNWAQRAWIESAKMLVAENRVSEAYLLSQRLAPFAPRAAQAIYQNLQALKRTPNTQPAIQNRQPQTGSKQTPYPAKTNTPHNMSNRPAQSMTPKANFAPSQGTTTYV